MLRAFSNHLRHQAVAYAALFIALGGTSYAAVTLPRNSVGTAQVINHSLRAVDFKSGQLPRGAQGPAGSPGAQGAGGPQGATGPQGLAGASGPAGTALAYARILKEGVNFAGSGKNVASLAVGHPASGVYCLSGLTFGLHTAQATVGFNGAAITAIVDLGPVAPCPDGTQITVGTYGIDGLTADNEFMIEMN